MWFDSWEYEWRHMRTLVYEIHKNGRNGWDMLWYANTARIMAELPGITLIY